MQILHRRFLFVKIDETLLSEILLHTVDEVDECKPHLIRIATEPVDEVDDEVLDVLLQILLVLLDNEIMVQNDVYFLDDDEVVQVVMRVPRLAFVEHLDDVENLSICLEKHCYIDEVDEVEVVLLDDALLEPVELIDAIEDDESV